MNLEVTFATTEQGSTHRRRTRIANYRSHSIPLLGEAMQITRREMLNDGGPVREYGWGRFPTELQDVNGVAAARAGAGLFGEIKLLRVYDQYLRTSELMGYWRAGAS
jgi:hypothetical protein